MTVVGVCNVQCWSAISERMKAHGWMVDSVQCDTKWKSLKKKFKELKDHNNTSGNSRRNWTFYDVSWFCIVSVTIMCNICVSGFGRYAVLLEMCSYKFVQL